MNHPSASSSHLADQPGPNANGVVTSDNANGTSYSGWLCLLKILNNLSLYSVTKHTSVLSVLLLSCLKIHILY